MEEFFRQNINVPNFLSSELPPNIMLRAIYRQRAAPRGRRRRQGGEG